MTDNHRSRSSEESPREAAEVAPVAPTPLETRIEDVPSMAAPHVTGLVALLMQAAGRHVEISRAHFLPEAVTSERGPT
jgi:hypothetical protein